jgi:hypothetical protein
MHHRYKYNSETKYINLLKLITKINIFLFLNEVRLLSLQKDMNNHNNTYYHMWGNKKYQNSPKL